MLIFNKHSKRIVKIEAPKTVEEYHRDIELLQRNGEIQLAATYRKHYRRFVK
jgi:hypothetical protein